MISTIMVCLMSQAVVLVGAWNLSQIFTLFVPAVEDEGGLAMR